MKNGTDSARISPEDLAKREIRHVRETSRKQDWEEHVLPRLLALAALAGGLDEEACRRLKETPRFRELSLEKIRELPLWNPRKAALEPSWPDNIAAAFLVEALLTGPGRDEEALPVWLLAALQGREEDFCLRLPRLASNIKGFSKKAVANLSAALEKMIEASPAAAIAFRAAGANDVNPASPFAVAVLLTLLEQAQREEEKADLLKDVSLHFLECGRGQDAVDAARRAVNIYRKLDNAAACAPALAASLSNLAKILHQLGRRQQVLKPAKEAVSIYRKLIEDAPGDHLPGLAKSLNNLSVFLSEFERWREAVDAAREAADIYRALAARIPETHLPELAKSLHNMGTFLARDGRYEEALDPIREAADIYGEITGRDQMDSLPELAACTLNLATILFMSGKRRQALKPAKEAMDIFGRLAEHDPQAYLPDLADSLGNLSEFHFDLGNLQKALEPAAEKVRICRDLAEQDREAFSPALAESLHTLAIRLAALKQMRAISIAKEAAREYRFLADRNPEGYLPDRARSLETLAEVQIMFGWNQLALPAIREALRINRKLARRNPEVFKPALVRTQDILNMLVQDLAGDLLEASRRLQQLSDGDAMLLKMAVRAYKEACELAGQEPSKELLAPILEALSQRNMML